MVFLIDSDQKLLKNYRSRLCTVISLTEWLNYLFLLNGVIIKIMTYIENYIDARTDLAGARSDVLGQYISLYRS